MPLFSVEHASGCDPPRYRPQFEGDVDCALREDPLAIVAQPRDQPVGPWHQLEPEDLSKRRQALPPIRGGLWDCDHRVHIRLVTDGAVGTHRLDEDAQLTSVLVGDASQWEFFESDLDEDGKPLAISAT